jgi:Na+/H+ antiporter NhaD/arsenite permease-like protein
MLLFFHLPVLTKTLLISLIAVLTLIGIMIRPFKFNEAMIAMARAALLLGFIAATIFGCDLGPNLTTVGSLATILWLLILRRRNLDVSGLDYFKIGIMVTPLMLLAGALTIWLMLL